MSELKKIDREGPMENDITENVFISDDVPSMAGPDEEMTTMQKDNIKESIEEEKTARQEDYENTDKFFTIDFVYPNGSMEYIHCDRWCKSRIRVDEQTDLPIIVMLDETTDKMYSRPLAAMIGINQNGHGTEMFDHIYNSMIIPGEEEAIQVDGYN